MKILIATDTYKPNVNGVVISVMNLRAGLEARGHEVRILTLSNTKESYVEDGVYYIGSQDMSFFYPNIRIKIKSMRKEVHDIVQWHPDVIHTQSEFSVFYIAHKISKKLSVPIVHTYHTKYEDYTHYYPFPSCVGVTVVKIWTQCVCKSAKKTIAPTQKITDILQGYPVACPVHVIPSGIALERFSIDVSPTQKAKMKQELAIPAHHFVMASISRIGKEKNVQLLVSYMAQLKDKETTLLIVGDGPYAQELRVLVEQRGLHDCVKFTGMIPPEQIASYYKIADLYVCASTSEAQGLTYVEALASGTPILCKQDECLAPILEEGKNGYAFETQEEFFDKLAHFKTKADRIAMRQSALATSQKYSIDTFAENVESLYLQVVAPHGDVQHDKKCEMCV